MNLSFHKDDTRVTFLVLTIFLLISCSASAFSDYGVGQRDYIFSDTARHRELATHVWYPIDNQIKMSSVRQKGNPFLPVVSAKKAPFPKGTKEYPVILLSHGSGGKADKLFWLADHLVRHGMIVVGVDHPGNMTGDNSADGLMRVWERPKDLSFVLDQIEKLPEFKSHLDLTEVGAVGHSAGGTTVLLLAGARFSPEKFQNPIPNCAGTKDPFFAKLCDQMKGINVKDYPKDIISGNYSNYRVRSVVALDPGFAQSFDPDSLKNLPASPLILISDKLNAPQDEIYSKEFLHLLPKVTEVVPKSFHMTFLQACKPNFPQDDGELKELCIENDQKLRIQEDVAAKVLWHLQAGFLEVD